MNSSCKQTGRVKSRWIHKRADRNKGTPHTRYTHRVSQTPLGALPRRPIDGAHALRNTGPSQVIYKLNAEPEQAPGSNTTSRGVLVTRDGGEFELQKRLCCPRCRLNVAYTVQSEGAATVNYKPEVTFLLPGELLECDCDTRPQSTVRLIRSYYDHAGAMTDAQGKLPLGALGDDQ